MRTLRTPDGRFTGLPDAGVVHHTDVDDGEGGSLRMAWVEDGPAGAPPVLLLHGEPTWSFLYRSVLPVLAAAGLRAIAPDLVGFGRSDKPAEIADHTYARHVEWVRALAFDVLDLRGVTLVGQDWGGLIGLRLVAEHPDRFARVVAANTGLPTGDRDMPEVWWRFRRGGQGRRGRDAGRRAAGRLRVRAPALRRRGVRLRRAVPGRVVQGRAAGDAAARPDPPGRPGDRGQPGRLGRAARAGPAGALPVLRLRPDHRADARGAAARAARARRAGSTR